MEIPENDKKQTKQTVESLTKEAPVPPESNVAPDPPAAEPIASIENKDSEGMSLKDKWSLIISCLALLLSIAGFTYQILNNRNQEARALKQENRAQNQEARIQKQEDVAQKQIAEAQRRARSHAYNLGKQFTMAYVVFTQTTKDAPQNIAAAKKDAENFLNRNTRELATALGLNPDLSKYLTEKRPEDIFASYNPFRSLQKKLSSFNTDETVAAFNVGYSLTFLSLERRAANYSGKQEPYKSVIYPAFRDVLNRNLGSVRFSKLN
jgi:hypothetical protein